MNKHTIAKLNEMGWSVTDTGGGFQSLEQQFGEVICWINDGEGSLPNGIINEPVTLHFFREYQPFAEPVVSIEFPSVIAANAVAQCIIL